MKKLIVLSVALLSLGFTSAKAEGSNEKSSAKVAVNVAALIEENAKLNVEVASLKSSIEDLKLNMDYQRTMNATINKLHEEESKEIKENADALKSYNNLMMRTLKNLVQ